MTARQNLIYIGDNAKVMESPEFNDYVNSVDLIYIDPPYNTKGKLCYDDKNKSWKEDFLKRIRLAHSLLSDSGVMFISIDDKELVSVLTSCYEVFGHKNFSGMFITKQAIRSNSSQINIIHEYVVCFCKNKKFAPKFYIKRIINPDEAPAIKSIISQVNRVFKKSGKEEAKKVLSEKIKEYAEKYNDSWIVNYNNVSDDGRIYFAKDLSTPAKPREVNIKSINLHLDPLKTRGWVSDKKFIELYNSGRLCFKDKRPYEIEYIEEATNNITSILDFYSRYGTNDLKRLGLYDLFDTPKPVELIKFLIRACLHQDGLVLDFYAGSGTTAQAVYEINKDDNMNHNYVLIQLDEPLNIKSAAYKKAIELGIKDPKVSDLMLCRIDRYLALEKKEKDYNIIKFN